MHTDKLLGRSGLKVCLMHSHPDEHGVDPITERIIGCAYAIANTLGSGFLEKVYENALSHELRKAGLRVEHQVPVAVHYDGVAVGEYIADLQVNQTVLVELKAVTFLDDVHVAQCLNYLKATGRRICLLINFGNPKVEIRRIAR